MSLYNPHPAASELRVSKVFTLPPCCTKIRESRHQASCLSQTDSLPPVISMNRPPPFERLEAVVSHAVPQVAVKSIRPLPPTTGGLQRPFSVVLSDDRTLLLKLPPSLMLRLLRWEQYLTLSEPCVITWIFREILERTRPPSPRIPIQSFVKPSTPTGFSFQRANVNMDHKPPSTLRESLLSCLPAVIASSTSNDQLGSPFSLWEPTIGTCIANLPKPLTLPERRLIEYQKGQLVRQISQLRAPNSRFGPAIAVLGGAPDSAITTRGAGLPVPPSAGSDGVATWSTAFLALMEGILRDGEDMAIMLSYTLIRGHMTRLSYTLDDVMESRLVLFDAGSDANVLVTRSTKTAQLEDGSRADNMKSSNSQAKSALTSGLPDNNHNEANTTANDSRGVREPTGIQGPVDGSAADAAEANGISIAGLQDWSNCIFGDPLMAKVFSRDPSDDFLRGFLDQPPGHSPTSTSEMPSETQAARTSLPPTPMATPKSPSPPAVAKISPKTRLHLLTPSSPPPPRIVAPEATAGSGLLGEGKSHGGGNVDGEKEDRHGANEDDGRATIRLLLYECYHATACVVKQFYRPSPPESTQREMAARRRLAEVLRKLDRVQREPPTGHSNSSSSTSSNSSSSNVGRRPKSRRANGDDEHDGGDGWPTKRARSEAGDE